MPPLIRSDVEEILLRHKIPNDFGHWVWNGAADVNGFGIAYIGDDLYRVADLSGWLWQGFPTPTVIPSPKKSKNGDDKAAIIVPEPVKRSCGLPYCFNPAHLVYPEQQQVEDEELELLSKHKYKNKNKKEDEDEDENENSKGRHKK